MKKGILAIITILLLLGCFDQNSTHQSSSCSQNIFLQLLFKMKNTKNVTKRIEGQTQDGIYFSSIAEVRYYSLEYVLFTMTEAEKFSLADNLIIASQNPLNLSHLIFGGKALSFQSLMNGSNFETPNLPSANSIIAPQTECKNVYTGNIIYADGTSPKPITISEHYDGEVVKYISSSKENGVNIVFLGDGFIKSDLVKNGEFEKAAKETIDYLMSVEPFNSYRECFNVYIVYAESKSQGADTSPELNDKDTVFNMTKNYMGVKRRLVAQDFGRVYEYVEKAIPYSTAALILACSNDLEYSGSGGDISSFSRHASSKYIALHETGHAFAKLGDEYVEASQISYRPIEDVQTKPNLDTTSDLTKIKWRNFIGLSNYTGVKAFEGGYYRSTGVWRPEESSIMRSLSVNNFNAPSREAIVRRIYSIINEPYSFDNFLLRDKTPLASIKRESKEELPMPDFEFRYSQLHSLGK